MEDTEEDMQADGVCCEDFWELLIGDLDNLIDNAIDRVAEIFRKGLAWYGVVREFFVN